METISFEQVIPFVFREQAHPESDIWRRKLTLTRGNTYLIKAASGTGKSSLCSFLYGYRNDYEGKIFFDRQDIRQLSVVGWTKLRQTSLSILFQDLRLFPELSVLENILVKNNLTHYKTTADIIKLLNVLGIGEKQEEKLGTLSYGQQQRVAFIRALCQPFDFILLDEPVSHLDDDNASLMAQVLMEETQKSGAGIIATSIGKHLPLNYTQSINL